MSPSNLAAWLIGQIGVCLFVGPVDAYIRRLGIRRGGPAGELLDDNETGAGPLFTGLVEELAKVDHLDEIPGGKRLAVLAPLVSQDAKLGDSISVNGCCLTVVAVDRARLEFEAGSETLSRTNLGQLSEGHPVNLERSMQVGDRIGGHLVTGHIDAVGTVEVRDDEHDWSRFWISVPAALTRQMANKGSVTVDGTSLTIVEVATNRFSVALIPHTLTHTNLGARVPGDRVNVETDVLAKYVERQLASGNLVTKES